jgi:DNA-binding response OmpR family regulator
MSGATVLVVEDDADVRDLLAWILRDAGIEVLVSSSADRALALAYEARPDVLVVDVGLPGADGLELIRCLRAVRSLADLPTIVLTGQDPFDVGRRSAELDIRSFLQKPLSRHRLLAAVQDCLPAGWDGADAEPATAVDVEALRRGV